MSPEYIEELAQRADPDDLWKLAGMDQLDLPPEKRKQLDTAVALRRYAHHLRDLRRAREAGKSWIITSFSDLGAAVRTIKTPSDHAKLRKAREDAYGVSASDGQTLPQQPTRDGGQSNA